MLPERCWIRGVATLTAVALMGALAGCQAPSSPDTGPTASTPSAQAPTPDGQEPRTDTIDLALYFVDGEHLAVVRRSIPATTAVATLALTELLAGLDERDDELALVSEIPERTALLGLDIADSIATVNLSEEFERGGGSFSMMMRVAQVVYTLTQFETVDAVRFMISGTPVEAIGGEGITVDPAVGRAAFSDYVLPPIFVESPLPGDVVASPMRVSGVASTPAATVHWELVDAEGRTVAGGASTTSAGDGAWAPFEFHVEYEGAAEGVGALFVYEESAEDGSRINVRTIALDLAR